MAKIPLKTKVMEHNDQIAGENRALLLAHKIHCINMIGSPGSGKTTLLEAVFNHLGGKLKSAVIEGDVKTDHDMQRILRVGVPAVQIETGSACHLNAEQVKGMLPRLPLSKIDLLLIENVGNLICPVSYQLGEHERMIVISVAEGEDKPLKYPSAFISSDIVVITKLDLAPYVDVNPEGLKKNALSLNPRLRLFMTSAKTGEGIDHLADYLIKLSKM